MTTAKIKIEKGVSIERVARGQKQIYPFDSLSIGDSFCLGRYRRKRAQSVFGSIYYYQSKECNKGKKFTCGKNKKDNTLVVWREK